jgi:hypothetical protein
MDSKENRASLLQSLSKAYNKLPAKDKLRGFGIFALIVIAMASPYLQIKDFSPNFWLLILIVIGIILLATSRTKEPVKKKITAQKKKPRNPLVFYMVDKPKLKF